MVREHSRSAARPATPSTRARRATAAPIPRAAANTRMRVSSIVAGTSMSNAEKIMKNGFKPSGDGFLGRGVYGAYEDKARDFAKLGGRHGGGHEGALLKCRVTVDEKKVKTRTHATNAVQLNGQTADCVWYPGGGSVGRPEVCITDSSKIEILGMERVAAHKGQR